METSAVSVSADLDSVFESASGYFALLAEPMRLKILHAICDRERTVGDIVAATGATQTTVSRHLGAMHRAGALSRRRDRNFTWYGVADATLTELCRTVCVHVAARELFVSPAEAPEAAGAVATASTRSSGRTP
jgi:DNA-binding transcriptional ArsR family regulator